MSGKMSSRETSEERMEPELVNVFTWKIKKSQLRKYDLLCSESFRIEGKTEEWCWQIIIEKKKSHRQNIVIFKLEKDFGKYHFPNLVKMKLSLGPLGRQIIYSETMRYFTEFKFSIKEEKLFILLRNFDTLNVNFTMKSLIKTKNNSPANLKHFLNNQSLSDVVFKIDENEFPAHKVILASVSQVFQIMFSHNMKQNSTNVIKLKLTDPNDFKELLNFIYTGQIENLDNVAFGLYGLANKYDIPDLREICEDHLYDSLSSDNVIDVLELADQQNSFKLKDECIEYIHNNFEQVKNTEPFRILDRGLLMDLLCAMKVKRPRKMY